MAENEALKPDGTQNNTHERPAAATGGVDFAALEAAQKQHLAEQQAEREALEAANRRTQEAQQALSHYTKLQNRRAELGRNLQEKGYNPQVLEGHRSGLERAKANQEAKNAELEEAKTILDQHQDNLDRVKALVGNNREAAAPEVREAWENIEENLRQAQITVGMINREIQSLNQEAEQRQAQLDQFGELNGLLDELAQTDAEVAKYLNDFPEIASQVEEEARIENEKRDEFINSVTEQLMRIDCSGAQGTGPERQEVVKDLVTVFLNEDMEQLGLDSIDQYDTRWFMQVFQNLSNWGPAELHELQTRRTNRYLHFENDKRTIEDYLKHYRTLSMAMAVRQILAPGSGKYGTAAMLIPLIRWGEDPRYESSTYGVNDRSAEYDRQQRSAASSIAKHGRFLNALLGALDGSKENGRYVPVVMNDYAANEIIGSRNSFGDDISMAGYYTGGGPLTPRDETARQARIDQETIDEWKQTYEQYKQKLTEIAGPARARREQTTNEQRQALTVQAESLRAEFGKLQSILSREAELYKEKLQYGGSGPESKMGINNEIDRLRRSFEDAQRELRELSVLNFLKKGKVQESVSLKQAALEGARKRLAALEVREQEIATQLAEIETTKRSGRLEVVRNQLQEVSSRLEQLR